MGINNAILILLKCFLTGCRQRISCGSCFLDWGMISNLVPEGSVPGLLLFTIFVNEPSNGFKSQYLVFTDDLKQWRDIKSPMVHNYCSAPRLINGICISSKHRKTPGSFDWQYHPSGSVHHWWHQSPSSEPIQETRGANTKEIKHFPREKLTVVGMRKLWMLGWSFNKPNMRNVSVTSITTLSSALSYCVQTWSLDLQLDCNFLQRI